VPSIAPGAVSAVSFINFPESQPLLVYCRATVDGAKTDVRVALIVLNADESTDVTVPAQ
jgi:hypothetical protein